MTAHPGGREVGSRAATSLSAAVLVALAWVFWPTLAGVVERWGDDPRYSHGYLVPLFSAYLLWSRRGHLARSDRRRTWVGLPLVFGGLAVRGVGTVLAVEWVSAMALLPCLMGVGLLAGGRRGLAWCWPAVAFLAFMLPLPYRVEVALSQPLQRIATVASTYALQTAGLNAVAEGNVIRLDGGTRLGVVEACGGLSMLLTFFALATAAAVVVRRPLYERLLLVVSAVPIALVANVARITVTGVLHRTVGGEIADRVFHDFAGWLMMPLAVVLLWAELWVLSRLVSHVPGSRAAARPDSDTPAGFASEHPPGGQPVRRTLLTVGVTCAVIAFGVADGVWTGRWSDDDLDRVATRVANVPKALGDWEGVDTELDAREVKIGRLRGHLHRTYTHRHTGESVTVMVLCGQPGAIAVHSPDVCFQGQGCSMTQQPKRLVLSAAGESPPAEAWTARFERPTVAGTEGFAVAWTWSADGTWAAPDSPRVQYARSHALFKLYVIRPLAPSLTPEGAEDAALAEFNRLFLPAVRAALFPTPDAP